MNKFFSIFLIGALAFASSGCTEEECDEWFEEQNDDCVEVRAKYYGTYDGTLSFAGFNDPSQHTFVAFDGDVKRIDIYIGSEVDENAYQGYLVLSSNSVFDIPLQSVSPFGQTYQKEGNGSFNGDQVTFTFTTNMSNAVYTFTGTK